jgi:hypothetical protein
MANHAGNNNRINTMSSPETDATREWRSVRVPPTARIQFTMLGWQHTTTERVGWPGLDWAQLKESLANGSRLCAGHGRP